MSMLEADEEIPLPSLSLKAFLEHTPLQTEVIVEDYKRKASQGWSINTPSLALYCPSSSCQDKGLLLHDCVGNDAQNSAHDGVKTYQYRCPNCKLKYKTFCILITKDLNPSGSYVRCLKIGEYPNFGPPTPSRLIKMIAPDRENFLKGRRSEIQGLGIGAFSYYRKIIEDQRNRIFDAIISVTKLLEPESELIGQLEAAKNETQFKKSMEMIKAGLPQTLRLKGEEHHYSDMTS